MSDSEKSPTIFSIIEAIPTSIVYQIKIKDLDILDKFYISCVKSKATRVVRQNKNMTATSNKREKMHANLWEPYNLLLEL